jgi:hypothetical protein
MDDKQESQLHTSSKGLFGQLLLDMGRVLRNLDMNSNIQFIGDFPVTKQSLCVLLSGIVYDPTEISTEYFCSPDFYQPGDNLVRGEHLQFFVDLLYQNGYTIQKGASFKPVAIPPHFATFIQSEHQKGNDDVYISLRSYLQKRGLWVEDQLLPDTFLVIVNLSNSHWILVHMFITPSLCTFFPMNPYHPAEPSEHDVFVGHQVANSFQQAFHTLQFQLETPHTTGYLPVQPSDDVVNCGIFVLMYILIFMYPDVTIELLLDWNKNILKWERYRVLLAAWLITKIEPKLA